MAVGAGGGIKENGVDHRAMGAGQHREKQNQQDERQDQGKEAVFTTHRVALTALSFSQKLRNRGCERIVVRSQPQFLEFDEMAAMSEDIFVEKRVFSRVRCP
jgi:hypothetical protein